MYCQKVIGGFHCIGRNPILWKWCHVLLKCMTQPTIEDEEIKTQLANLKLNMIMTNVLIDDLADNLKQTVLVDHVSNFIIGTLDESNYNWDKIDIDMVINQCKSNSKLTMAIEDPLNGSAKFETYINLLIESWKVCLKSIFNYYSPDEFKQSLGSNPI